MKTAVIIGRFQPISIAHKEIIQDAIEKYDETYVIVVNSVTSIIANANRRRRAQGANLPPERDPEGWERSSARLPKSFTSSAKGKEGKLTSKGLGELEDLKNTNPFSGMMRKKLIYKAFGGKLHESHIISHGAANIQQIVNKIHHISKNTDFVILCGADRKAGYEAQIKGGFARGYFSPEIENVEVGVIPRDVDSADNVSATKIRDAIKDDDFTTFKALTPKGIHSEFDNLKRILMQEMRNIPFFNKMLVEMIHIEDLKVDEFINFVKNIYETEASVKLDGTAALAFGFDEDGRFYTGFGRDFKEIKPEYRRYSTEDWLKQKNIFINPAASAHTFLEKHLTTIKKHISPGETVLAEVLFGDKPNCIKYDFSGINYLVILNNDRLADSLDGRKSNVDTVNYVLDTDQLVPKAVKQVWRFGKTQRVNPSKYEINIENELQELEIFLNAETEGIRNIDIIGMKAIGKNKELVKKVREKAESYKLNIKEKLLEQFVRKIREGDYIPSEGYSHEGIVLKLGDERVKIIDKEVFTAIHDKDWEPVHAAKKIVKNMGKDEASTEITRMIDNFDELYPDVSSDVKTRMKNSLRMIRINLKEGSL